MRIRAFAPSDTADLVRVFQSAVTEVGACYYADSAVRAWLGAVDDIVAFEGRLSIGLTLVAETNDGQIAAFGQLHPGDCVHLLYCAPAFGRRGYATAVYPSVRSHRGEASHHNSTHRRQPKRAFFLRTPGFHRHSDRARDSPRRRVRTFSNDQAPAYATVLVFTIKDVVVEQTIVGGRVIYSQTRQP